MQGDVPAELQGYMEMTDEDYEYRLVGINIHRGSGQGGHYWSLIHTKRGEQEPDPSTNLSEWENGISSDWRKFDDETVTPYATSSIPEDAFGGQGGSMSAYE